MLSSLIDASVDLGVSIAAVGATTTLGFLVLRLMLGGMARRLKSTH